MARRVSSPVFVGRAAELERLSDALEQASAGRPSLVLVAGEAGVGKSRLVGEFIARTAPPMAVSLVGACLDLGGGGLPYAPFTEALRGWMRGIDTEARTAIIGPSDGALALLVPDLRSTGGLVEDRADPAARQARLFDAVLALLGRLAAERPAILVLEDLHWADGSTRDLVRFLVRNLRDERLMIVGTYRSDDLHRRHPLMPLLSELERSDRVDRVELRRFSRAELRDQVAGITGAAPRNADVDTYLERSDGIPFYVEELVTAERGAASAMPSSLREILGLRLASLAEDDVAVVRAASVVGARVPHDRLAAVADADDRRLGDALRRAIEAGILVSADPSGGPAFAFRHALLREAAYDELLPTEQVRLHGRLADHLATQLTGDRPVDPAVVADFAVHAYHAHDQRRALAGSVHAMRVLAETGAFREALGHAERALELWPRVVDAPTLAGIDHVDLLAFAARMAGNSGQPERAVAIGKEALREVDPGGDPARAASLLIDLWSAAWEAWDEDAMGTTAEQMTGLLDALPPTLLKAHVLYLVGYHHSYRSLLSASVPPLEEALKIARLVGDDRMVTIAASALAASLAPLNRAGRAEEMLAAARLSSSFYDATPWTFWAAADQIEALWGIGRFEAAVAVAAQANPIAARYGLDRRVGHWLAPHAALFELGRVDEAAEIETRAIAHSGGHLSVGQGWVVTLLDIMRGQLDRARRSIQLRRERDATLGMITLNLSVMLARAEGHFEAARAAADEGLLRNSNGAGAGDLVFILGDAIGAAADAAVAARRRRRADGLTKAQADGRRWMERLRTLVDEARADGGAGEFAEAKLATAEAEMGRLEGESAPAAWVLATERWADLSHVYWTAYTRLRFAEVLLATDRDRAGAEAALRDARAGAVTLGAGPLLSSIETVAHHARIDLEPGPAAEGMGDRPSAPAAVLTGRERDVLDLVAEGHTNREIGDRLFISEKTVSVHVSNAMAKLGALSRYEAAATAERLGLLP